MKTLYAIINGMSLAMCIWLANSAPSGPLTIRPITQEQYNSIIGLRENVVKKPEGRFITNGLAVLGNIAAGVRSGLTNRWLPNIFSNFMGTQRNATKATLEVEDNYPLCIVKEEEEDADLDDYDTDIGRSKNDEFFKGTSRVSIVECIAVIRTAQKGQHRRKTKATTATFTPTYTATETITTTSRPPDPIQSLPFYHTDYNYPYGSWYGGLSTYPQYYSYPYQHYEPYNPFMPQNHLHPTTFDDLKRVDENYRHYSRSNHNGSQKSKIQRIKNRNQNRYRKLSKSHLDYFDTRNKPVHRSGRSHQPNYAKNSNYPDGGYQPAFYPRVSYQSQYPKVAYSSPRDYSSPVYVQSAPQQQSEHFQEQKDP